MEKTAIRIVKKFQEAGFEAYFAGGSVRDLLMGNPPTDYDIATSATPDDIEKIVKKIHKTSKSIPIGKQFGVILGVVNGHQFEIATFRSDSSYSDGRRPDAVLFTSAKEDAVRRDFTINGLFYDPIKKKVLDFVGGQKDIKNKILRFIGNPHERIKEDHLRLLRAVRFKNQFGFQYGPKAKQAIQELAHLVDDISRERVADELTKMLLHPRRAHSFRELDRFGVLGRILPEVTAGKGIQQPEKYHQEGDVFIHELKSLHDIPNDWASKGLVWAVLLHDIGKKTTFEELPDRIHFNGHAELGAHMAKAICQRLKFSKAETNKIVWLIGHHMTVGFIPDMRRAHQVALFQHPWFIDLMRLTYCDEHGSVPVDLRLYNKVMELYKNYQETPLLEGLEPLYTGDDLMKEFGLKPGPQIKKILEFLWEEQVEGAIKTKAQAKKAVKQYLKGF
ncbi:MAG: CCA tRNA nucleotidyltransferase [Candidatus Peregrinibacteria bacterium]